MMKRLFGCLLALTLALLCLAAASAEGLTVTAEETTRVMNGVYNTDWVGFLSIDVVNNTGSAMEIAVTTSDNVQFDPYNSDWRDVGIALSAGEKLTVYALPTDDLTVGEHNGWVKFDADNGDTHTVELTFIVLDKMEITPLEHNFGNVLVTDSLPTAQFAVTNTWAEEISVSASPSEHFFVDLDTRIAPGATEMVTVSFSSIELGLFEMEDLYLYDSISGVFFQPVSLSFNGYTDAPLAPDTLKLDWGEAFPNDPGEGQPITLTNNTDQQVTVTASTGNYYWVRPTTLTLEAGASGTMDVTLNKDLPLGEHTETITFTAGEHTAQVENKFYGVSPVNADEALHFGVVAVGDELPGYRGAIVMNVSNGDLEYSVTVPQGFEVDPTCLNASGKLYIPYADEEENIDGSAVVMIRPTVSTAAAGEYTGSLVLTDTNCPSHPVEIELALSVREGGGRDNWLTAEPSAIDLGEVDITATDVKTTIKVTNSGDADIAILNFTYSGSESIGMEASDLPANDRINVTFTFDGGLREGVQNEIITLTGNTSSLEIPVTYTGVSSSAAPDPLTADIYNVALDEFYANDPAYGTVTLTNNTEADVTVTASTSDNYFVTLSSSTIPARGSVTATLGFNSKLPVGAASETVTFSDGTNSVTVTLSGTVLDTFAVSPASITFDSIEADGTLPGAQTVTVTNLSGVESAYGVTLPEGFEADTSDFSGEWLLSEGEDVAFTVRPTTNAPGEYAGNLVISEMNTYETKEIPLSYFVLGPSPMDCWAGTDTKYLSENYNLAQVTPVEITLQNTGDSEITVTAQVQGGTLSETTVTLAAGATQQLKLMPPSGLAVGDHEAAVTFTSSTGHTASIPAVTFKVVKDVAISPTEIDFGELSTIGEIPSKTFTLTNSRSIFAELAPMHSTYFNLDPAYAEMAAGESLTVTVSPKEIMEGSVSEAIEIGDNFDEDIIFGTITVKYTGVKPTPLVASVGSLDFGSVYINAPGAGKKVTLTNNTKEAVSITASAGDHYTVNLAADTIPALGKVEAEIALNADIPLGEGNDTVTFTANGDTVKVNLTYTGITPLEVTQTSLDFGGIAEGFPLPEGQTVTVKNLSSGTMAVKFTEPSGYEVDRSNFAASGWLLLEEGTRSVNVTITPTATAVGSYDGSLVIELMNNGETRQVALSFNVAKVEQAVVVETIEELPEEPVQEPTLVLTEEAKEELPEDVTLHFAKVDEEIPEEEEIPADEPVVGTVTYEVFLKDEEGNEVELDAACQLIFPYPEGLSVETVGNYEITIVHHADGGADTYNHNEISFLPQGMAITVHSFSPFEITFKREPGRLSLSQPGEAIVLELVQGYDVKTLTLPTFSVSNGGQSDITVTYTAAGDSAVIDFVNETRLNPGKGVMVTVTPKAGLVPGEYKTDFTFTANTGEVLTQSVVIKVTAVPKAPDTGDPANPLTWVSLLAAAALAMPKRKKK